MQWTYTSSDRRCSDVPDAQLLVSGCTDGLVQLTVPSQSIHLDANAAVTAALMILGHVTGRDRAALIGALAALAAANPAEP